MASSQEIDRVFVCQECRKPLKIVERKGIKDSTLQSFQTDDLPPFVSSDHKKKESDAVKLIGESFVVLSDSQLKMNKSEGTPGSANFHAQVQALTKIFEVVSDKCQIDCPLCDKCNYDIQKQLKEKIHEVEQECAGFKRCIATLQKENIEGQSERQKQEQEKERKLSKEVQRQIEEIKRQRKKLERDTLRLESESKKLEEFENKFWEEYQEYQLELSILQDTQVAIQQKTELTKLQLEQLKSTNVFDDAFNISSKGHFGSINGFKLGRLPAQSVGWDEINAALGQVVLLLHCIAKRVRYKFKEVILHPMGSYSRIADKRSPEVLNELYNYNSNEFFLRQGSSSSSAGKRFNTALALLLKAVKELGDYGAAIDPSFKLPKSIQGDKIEGKSIQAVAAEVDWTRALKYLLLDLKALLAWCSKESASGWKQR